MLNISQNEDLHLKIDAFRKMRNLRFLNFYSPNYAKSCGVHVPEGIELPCDELRYFQWDGFPLNSLPQTFNATQLVMLRMPQSRMTKLWDGLQVKTYACVF